MPSDPLPLSPETRAGRAILNDFMTGDGLLNRQPPRGMVVEQVIAIEQEARTLARAEVIAEAKGVLQEMPRAGLYRDDVLAALSRLGERE